MTVESNENPQPVTGLAQKPLPRWSLTRMRQEEKERSEQYHGLAAAWHVWRPDYGVAFVLFFLAVILSLVFLRANTAGGFASDDGYVTQKLAQNLLRYHRFTFDGGPDRVVAGSPLQVILIALIALVTRRTIVAAFFLGVLTLAGAAIAGYYWSREVAGSRRIAAVSGMLLVTSGWMIFDALSGMETMLFVMLILIALSMFEKRSIFTGIPLTLAVITSPDAWYFIAGVAIYVLVRLVVRIAGPDEIRNQDAEKRSQKSPEVLTSVFIALTTGLAPNRKRPATFRRLGLGAVVFGAFLLVGFLLNHLVGGWLIPPLVPAKSWFLGESGLLFSQKWRLWLDGFRVFYSTVIMPWPIVIVAGLVFARRFWTRFYLPVVLILFGLAGLLLFPVSFGQDWNRQQHVFIPVVLLAVAEGSFAVVRLARTLFVKSPRIARLGVTGIAIAVFALLVANQVLSIVSERTRYVRSIQSVEYAGEALVRYIQRHSRKDDPILAQCVGYLSLRAGKPILDLTGQVNSDIARRYRNPVTRRLVPLPERNVLDYVLERRPTLMVVREDPNVDWRALLNFDPDRIPEHFAFLGQGPPIYPRVSGGYRIYGVKSAPSTGIPE
jgi:hypothetical protein